MALQFGNFSTDTVNCGTLSSWNPTAFTVCMWCTRPSGTNTNNLYLCSKGSWENRYIGTSTTAPLDLEFRFFKTAGNLVYQTDDTPIARDSWNFIAVTFNLSNSANDLARIYVGGLVDLAMESSLGVTTDGGGNYGQGAATSDFVVSNNTSDADRSSDGDYASVAVIDEELTLAQIHTIQYQFRNSLAYPSQGWWELGLTANASSSQPDYSGNGHSGTPGGLVLAPHVPLVVFPSLPGMLVAAPASAPTVINCTLGAVEVAGLNVSVGAGTTINASLGAIDVAGLAAGVGAGTQVNASLGAIEVAGLAAGVGAGTQVNASLGAIEVAGLAAGVGAGTQVNASLGAIDVAGLVVTLPIGVVVDCGIGAIDVAGLVAGVGAGTQVNVSLGAVEVAGLAAGVGAGTQVNASLGAIDVAGLAASISAGRDIAISLGTIEVAGHAVSGSSGQTLLLNTGQFTVVGLPVSISAGTVFAVGLGAVQVAGLAATITNPQTVTASLGAVDVAGLPVSISAGTVLAVGVGAIDVLGLPVGVGAGTQVNASLGLVDVLGLPATVMAPSGPIGVTLGVIEISGHNVVIAISIGHTLGPESGAIETGPESGFIETGPELGLIEYNDIGVIE